MEIKELNIIWQGNIVKTLGIPQIRYVCNVLVPPEYFISNIKNIIVDFVWSGGSSKIKYNAIINDNSEGGLSLPDIESIVKTRRIIWLKQIFNERNCLWQIIPRFYFNMIGIPRIDINLNVTRGINKIPIFYRACLLDWNILFMNEPIDYTNVLAQPLWNNRFITSNNKPIYLKDMSEAGIDHIADIVTDDGKLQSFDKLGLPDCKIFEWLILKHSIRKHWLEMVQIEGLPQKKLYFPYLVIGQVNIKMNQLKHKLVYNYLIQSKREEPSGKVALENILQNELNLKAACKILYTTTIESSLRSFQFKILHNILPTNYILHRWKLKNSPRCSYCFINNETLDHLFCTCDKSITFYQNINIWLSRYNLKLPDMSVHNILIGLSPSGIKNCLVNHRIMLYKYCVFQCRENENNLIVQFFIKLLKNREMIEKNISHQNSRYSFHLRKWARLLHNF